MATASPFTSQATLDPLQTVEVEDRLTLEEQEAASNSDGAGDEDDTTDDGQSIVGISIGQGQTRLTSPTTPAAEKAAALDDFGKGSFFDGALPRSESPERLDFEDTPRALPFPSQSDTDARDFAHPQIRAGSQQQARSTVKEDHDYRPSRARASTVGYSGSQSGQHEKRRGSKFSLSSLPSLSKFSSIPVLHSALSLLHGSNDNDMRHTSNIPSEKSSSPQRPQSASRNKFSDSRLYNVSGSQSLTRQNAATQQRVAPLLRRATSDHSLQLSILSRTSSLGDDSRWLDVHAQVNSRMKAIKDSLADSSIRLPSMPSLSIGKRPSSISLLSGSDRRTLEEPSANEDLDKERWTRTRSAPNPNKADAITHPHFNAALENLEGDVVIMGGYRGSVLRWTEPPQRQCWVPVKVGLNLRKVNLEVGLEKEDEEKMSQTIFPSGMLKNIGPVEISRRLFKRLRQCKNAQEGKLRVWDYGYDWRLSPHLLSRQLLQYLEKLPCNLPGTPADQRGATVIAHSLGGLITRHAVNTRPELFSGVLYAGVPQTCVNILGPLRNGDDVLLSSRVLTAQVNFTIRTSFALLPLDGKCFFNRDTKERYDVDFFDANTWKEHHLSPCINRPLPPLAVAQPGMINSLVGSMASVLDSISLGGKKESSPPPEGRSISANPSRSNGTREVEERAVSNHSKPILEETGKHTTAPQMDTLTNPQVLNMNEETTVSTAVTIPFEQAYSYLSRTLSEIKQFKMELAFKPALKDKYPPAALIYGKSVPTVYGACVRSREAIKHADAYDNLAFASGDGVVLARAAQLPDGYEAVRGGTVSSERGHIALLGDLEAVGRCLNAIIAHRKKAQRPLTKKVDSIDH